MESKNINEQPKEPPGMAIYIGNNEIGRKRHFKKVLQNFDTLRDYYIPKISERITKARKKCNEGDIDGMNEELLMAGKELGDLSALIGVVQSDIATNYGNIKNKKSK